MSVSYVSLVPSADFKPAFLSPSHKERDEPRAIYSFTLVTRLPIIPFRSLLYHPSRLLSQFRRPGTLLRAWGKRWVTKSSYSHKTSARFHLPYTSFFSFPLTVGGSVLFSCFSFIRETSRVLVRLRVTITETKLHNSERMGGGGFYCSHELADRQLENSWERSNISRFPSRIQIFHCFGV